jgi:hypothetical protein
MPQYFQEVPVIHQIQKDIVKFLEFGVGSSVVGFQLMVVFMVIWIAV